MYVPGTKGVRSLGTEGTDDFELLCKCWGLNPGALLEYQVLLTIDPFVQPPFLFPYYVDLRQIAAFS